MKRTLNTFLAAAGIMVCFFQFSCKKSDPVQVQDIASLLQNKNWKLTSGTVSPAMGGITNWYAEWWDDCERDDLYRFNPSNVFLLDEGASTCSPGDPQTHNGTWSYTDANKTLHFALAPPSDNYDLTIQQINETTFSATSIDVISGVSYTSTWIFVRQS